MPRKIVFYASEDDLSNKLIKILNGLISEIKSAAKISSKDMWPAFATTIVKILLPSTLGVREELECEIWTSPKNYEEERGANIVIAKMPVSDMFGFDSSLKSATSGRGFYSLIETVFEKLPSDLRDSVIISIRKRKGLPEQVPKPET
jgi:translation elongation factor EF-G